MKQNICQVCHHPNKKHKIFAINGSNGQPISDPKPHCICTVGKAIGMGVICNCDFKHSTGLEMMRK